MADGWGLEEARRRHVQPRREPNLLGSPGAAPGRSPVQ